MVTLRKLSVDSLQGVETLEDITTFNGELSFIVSVTCPLCSGDRLEPEYIGYTCCQCGQYFTTN